MTVSANSGKERRASTKELMEAAVQLTADITEAFGEIYKDNASSRTIPVKKSVREIYDKEVKLLLKWKEANDSKLGSKVTSHNKGVWEALQAVIFDMTDLLSECFRHPCKR